MPPVSFNLGGVGQVLLESRPVAARWGGLGQINEVAGTWKPQFVPIEVGWAWAVSGPCGVAIIIMPAWPAMMCGGLSPGCHSDARAVTVMCGLSL